jgi:hypothetical protein
VAAAPAVYRTEWRWTRDDTPAHLSLWCLGESEHAIVCSGRPQNRKNLPEEVKFLIRRRVASGAGDLESVFASVFEPFADAPAVRKVERLALAPAPPGAVALRIALSGRADLVVFGAGEAGVALPDGTRVRGDFAYLALDGRGAVLRAYVAAGGALERGEFRLGAPAAPLKIVAVDWLRGSVTMDGPLPSTAKPGDTVLLGAGLHAFEVCALDRDACRIDLGDQECVVARGDVGGVKPDSGAGASPRRWRVQTSTSIPYARAGMHLLDDGRAADLRIEAVERDEIVVSGTGGWPEGARRFLVVTHGPGDEAVFSSPAVFPEKG